MADEPILEPGLQNNPDVERLQELLRVHINPNLKVDGDYGDATEAAVRQMQARHGLPETGVVDATTWVFLAADPVPDGGGMVAGQELCAEGQRLVSSGDFTAAIEKFHAALAAADSVDGLDAEGRALVVGNIAVCYGRLGDAGSCAQWAKHEIELDGTDAAKRAFQLYYYASTNQLGALQWGSLAM